MTKVASITVSIIALFQVFEANAFVSPRSVNIQSRTTSLKVGSIIELEDSNYKSLFRGDRPVLIDVCAPWCGPCKLIEPVLQRCAEKWNDSLVVGKFNVESGNNDLKVELLLQGVMPKSLPSLILIHKNKAITEHSGIISDDELDELLKGNFPKQQPKSSTELSSSSTTKTSGFVSFGAGVDDYMLGER